MLDDRNAVMVMNGSPQTRSWYRNALTAKNPTINENENGCMWRALHVQIYTPIMLTRYGGSECDAAQSPILSANGSKWFRCPLSRMLSRVSLIH